ncbi:hypothetical protein I7I51_06857 [Histoplasma capsulatum]|uniref:Uncharacterized protein n=1 Tax=Ajellomyces capsulatus TaxID=5037 RepID=A0A8A1MHQ1_AJECA|nr:hypothetical protein I7I51_06857 [Histoplasma capsulatum]
MQKCRNATLCPGCRDEESRPSVRRGARYFARKVYAMSPELFTLCSLSYTISGLPKIPPGTFYDQLEQWWAPKPPRESLSEVTSTLCQDLSRIEGESLGSSAILSADESRSTSLPLVTHSSLPLAAQPGILGNVPLAGERNGILDMIFLFIGLHLSFVADLLGILLRRCRGSHRAAGWMVMAHSAQ